MSPSRRSRLIDAVWALTVVVVATCLAYALFSVWSLREAALDSHEERDALAANVEALRAQLEDLGAEPVVGPPGTVGDRGPVGPEGPRGPKGQIGLAGPAGEPGEPGESGTDGTDGATGATGPMGPVGPIGPVGPQGQTGATGPQGPAGRDGEDGTIPDPITFIVGATTYTCTDPDGDGTYTCTTSITTDPIGG